MKLTVIALLAAMALSSPARVQSTPGTIRLFDLHTAKEMTLAQALPELERKRIILVGEIHDLESSHQAQLAVIRALKEAGVRVAIGLEMFRTESQNALDRWVEGKMGQKTFERVYYQNWNLPWTLYSPIFDYAREQKIPMVGLNVPPEVTRQVAEEGFQSLSPQQRGALPNVTCKVGPEYMAFIKEAYGEHAHGTLNFTYFCEAQLVWDKSMAINAVDYVKAHPSTILVLLAGTGHAWRKGIPRQIGEISKVPCVVILPEVPGFIEPVKTRAEDADYILLGLSGKDG
jgi:uncharacterized iron-regulated protein